MYLMAVYTCSDATCSKEFNSKSGRDKHIKRIHRRELVACKHGCGRTYVNRCPNLRHHEQTCDQNPDAARIGQGIRQQFHQATSDQTMRLVRTAHGDNFSIYRKSINSGNNIYGQLRHAIMNDCRGVIRNQRDNVKFYVTGKFIFEKASRPGVETDPPIYFQSNPIATTRTRPIQEALESTYQNLLEKINIFIKNGSGWALKAVHDVDIRVATYDPLRATSYLRLPKTLHDSNSVLNIQNYDDDKCGLWCILARLFPQYTHSDRNRLVNKPEAYSVHENDIITNDIQFPLQIRDIGKLEKWNNLSINVFTITPSGNEVVPIRISEKKVSDDRTVDLLYIAHGVNTHYCLITNLAGLCRSQVTTHHESKYLCRRCLHFCRTDQSYQSHLEKCSKHDAQKTVFPMKNDVKGRDKVRYTKIERQLPLPFYFVADFECIMDKLDTCTPDATKSSSTVLSKHVPCGAAYKISCTDPRFYRPPVVITPDVRSGKSVAERFLDEIQHDARELRKMLACKIPMTPLTADEQAAYDAATTCHICDKTFVRAHCHNELENKTNCAICIEDLKNDIKVRDHNHLDGRYRGPAHSHCNFQYRIVPNKIQIPCFFHNLKHYDAHLLMSAAKPRHGKITCVPTTTEKYISFTIGDVVFKDSYAFTQASLGSLVANLGTDKLVNTRRWLESQLHHWDRDVDDDEEDKPTEFDMTFIDDRPADELDGRRKRRLVFDDDDDDWQSSVESKRGMFDDDAVHTPRKRGLIGDVDDDVVLTPRRQRLRRMLIESDNDDDNDNNDNDDDDDVDSSWDVSDDDDGDDDYYGGMPDFDYRLDPYSPPILSDEENELVEVDLKLLGSKGIYPYEYMDSFSKFKEREIPQNIDAFKSSLTGETITEDEHTHAKHVFKHFGMKTLQDYHNLYLLQDVFLLDDVLTAFREVCLETYGLDPWHYYTAPGLTWDAGLKYTDVTLDLLTADEQFLFVEAGLRGGVSMISHRHAKANHPDLEEVGYYDKDEPLRQILYLDANNLYGWAMSQHLPVSAFEWMSDEKLIQITESWISSLAPDGDMGYILEVDLEYPPTVHSKHWEYPLAPERRTVKGFELSPYQRNILRDQYLTENPKLSDAELYAKIDAYESAEKLVPNLHNKKNYILHYRNLQLYLKLGMRLTRVHRVLCFQQSAWLKPYIEHNTEKRKHAKNDFEKDFYKLMNNAFFGKTMENVRKRRLINLVNTPQQMKKLVAQPTFKTITVFNEDLSAIERLKTKVKMDKPISAGMCVLDLSKWLMYDFFYNSLKLLFPTSQLLFTDTDSLCVSIEGVDDVYKSMHEGTIKLDDGTELAAASLFDFSNYPPDHLCHSPMNKKVPGKMKDELGGNILLEFIGLRAKAYAYKKLVLYPSEEDNEMPGDIIEVKKLKGIKKCVVKKSIHFKTYKSCLFDEQPYFATMTSLRAFLHEIQTLQVNKVSMTHFDDKRFLMDDGIGSIPYGHHFIAAADDTS